DVIIAFDLPTQEQLAQLVGAGETVLLVPPGTEGYVDRIASPQRPLRLPGVVEELARAAAQARAAIVAELDAGRWQEGVHALAPLLERHDAVRVAAALYALWKRMPAPATAAPASSAAPEAGTARVWVSVGKKDGLTASDLVGALTREHRLAPSVIGRIELRETFSLVEVTAGEAERVAQALHGSTIRRTKVVARLDRGTGRPAARPRGGSR
ncbi:MAG: DbpA RNA binding domain-containing protein, partial [Gemmatimonadales bacterium]|nr:DbpA RNA binding domain-containing protein [Gemmatimonadales bacterium]